MIENSKLSKQEIADLREAILFAYQNEGDLQIHLGIIEDFSYNQMAGNTYEQKVSSLINDFVGKETTGELLEVLFQKRPNNKIFKKLREKIIPSPYRKWWDSLIGIIKEQKCDIDILTELCRQVFAESNFLQPPKISPNLISLMGIFCIDYQRDKDNLENYMIIKFADKLTNSKKIDESIREKFKQWLSDKPRINSPLESNQHQERFLYIFICPLANNRFYVTPQFIISEKQADNLSNDQQELGFYCNSLGEIETKLSELVDNLINSNLQLTDMTYTVTVEFFLPLKYLDINTEQWKIVPDTLEPASIASQESWNCVNRCYELHIKPNVVNELRTIWQNFGQKAGKWQEKFTNHLKAKLSPEELSVLIEEGRFNMKLPEDPNRKDTYLKAIIRSKARFWIWYRGTDEQIMNELYTCTFNKLDELSDLSELKEIVSTQRRKGNQLCLGLLLEDLDRWPKLPATPPGN